MDAATSLSAPEDGLRLRWRLTPLRLVGLLTMLALVLRLIGIELRPLWLDEGYSAWFSSRSWHVLWTEVPTYEPHPPFYYSLLKLWREAFGGSSLALRSFSVLLSAATVPVVMAASSELERLSPSGRPMLRAGVAALLVACSPMLVLIGEEARPYPLLVFAYALASLGLLRLMREFADDGAGEWKSWAALAAGTEVALWAHGLGALYALSLAGALAPAWLRGPVPRDRVVRGIAAAAAITLLYLPCLILMLGRTGDWGTGWLSWDSLMMLQLISLYTVPFEVFTIASAIAALIMVLLFKRALVTAFEVRGWNAEHAMLLLWWGPPILAAIVSQLAIPVFLVRTLTPTIVPAALVLSGALARSESPKERFAFTAALAITLVVASVQIALRPAAEAWDEVASFLDRNVKPGERVWLYPNDSALPLREAGAAVQTQGIPRNYPAVGFKGPIRAGSPAVVSLTAPQALQFATDPALRDIPVIWLVTRQSELFDPRDEVPKSLAHVRRAGPITRWGYIAVQPFYRR